MCENLKDSDRPRMAGVLAERIGDALDTLAGLPLILWCMVCAASTGSRFFAGLAAVSVIDLVLLAELAARAAVFCFLCCMIAALSLRAPAVARAAGLLPRLVALGGAFSVTGLALFPRAELPVAVTLTALALMLLGYGLGCYTVAHLGRSLSLAPEARHLVTSGPYRLVRHPLYVAETVASAGLVLQVISPGAVLLWVIHLALQFQRLRWEEQVLRASFPAYAGYAARVPCLLPGLGRGKPAKASGPRRLVGSVPAPATEQPQQSAAPAAATWSAQELLHQPAANRMADLV